MVSSSWGLVVGMELILVDGEMRIKENKLYNLYLSEINQKGRVKGLSKSAELRLFRGQTEPCFRA